MENTMKLKLATCSIGAALIVLGGCASVPAGAPQLSANIGRNINAIEKSHLFYVRSYYEALEAQANGAVDQSYAPAIVGAALKGDAGKELLLRLEAGGNGATAQSDALTYTARFLSLLRNKVEEKRKSDIEPIRKAKQAALANTQAAYAQLARSNETITAYLGSLVKLHATQDKLFADIGMPDVQDHVARTLVEASDQLEDLLQVAEPPGKETWKASVKKNVDEK
jgi:hypothetical protein